MLPPPPQAMSVIRAGTIRASENNRASERCVSLRCLIRLVTSIRINKSENRSMRREKLTIRGVPILGNSARMIAARVVETVTVTEVAFVPSSPTKLGITVQVERGGAPVQLTDTGWLNPPAGETETEYVAV